MRIVSFAMALAVLMALGTADRSFGEETNAAAMVAHMMTLFSNYLNRVEGASENAPINYYRNSGMFSNSAALVELASVFPKTTIVQERQYIIRKVCEHWSARNSPGTGVSRPIDNPLVVGVLLDALDDTNENVRVCAMNELYGCDVSLLKGHEAKIVKVINDDRRSDRKGAFLLARLGSVGLEYLRDEEKTPFWKWDVRAALAMAGDTNAEQRVIAWFDECTNNYGWKAYILPYLGAVGTERTLLKVAQQLRSPLIAVVETNLEYTVRFAALRTLHDRLPEEPALKYSLFKFTNEDWDRVEKWVEQRFNISWTNDRPPFVPYVPPKVQPPRL